MAAGLGFKTFTTGEVLTAADTNGYLMQGILVFASAAGRDAAITSPQEGQFAYLKDTNVTTYYTGSAWANVDTTGMTNPMTTTGDVIYSSSGSTPARLGIGTANQVLRVNSGATAPEWATPAAGGGITLISETVASALSSLSFSSIPGTYKDLTLVWNGVYNSNGTTGFGARLNNDSTASIYKGYAVNGSNSIYAMNSADMSNASSINGYVMGMNTNSSSSYQNAQGSMTIFNYASSSKFKQYQIIFSFYRSSDFPGDFFYIVNGTYCSTSAVTSLDIVQLLGSGTFSNVSDTSIRLYGVS